MLNLVKQSPIKHCYQRPPPWPSQTNCTSFQTAKTKSIHAAIIMLFSHLSLLFRSYLCSYTMTKTSFRYHDVRQKVFASLRSLFKVKNTKQTVIQQFKRKNVRIPTRLFNGALNNFKSAMLFLFIAVNFLSTSDLSSSDGRKSHFVASAIGNANNGARNAAVRPLRCYICGGNTGIPCEDIRSSGRRSPYVRPKPQTTLDGRKMFENCTDLINNKGCIKQVINGGE